MIILTTAMVFILCMGLVSLLGIKLWLRPKEALDRVTGATIPVIVAAPPSHPSLVIREILTRIGTRLPASPKDLAAMQKRLVRAGYRSSGAIRVMYGAKLLLAMVLPLAASIPVLQAPIESQQQFFLLMGLGLMGFILPSKYVAIRAKRRQKEVKRGLANALDLLVVCVESGLGLDQAILQVAKELEHAHPEVAEEFALVNLELKAGKRRAEALRNLAYRTEVEDLKKLVAVLLQADRFGTGIAQSLRGHSEYMRVHARQQAEEIAAKLGVKLVFPIFFCILPALFVVTVGPVGVKIVDELIPAMTGM